MRRRIYFSICITSLAALLLSTAASLLIYYNFYEIQTEQNLRNECQLIAVGAESASDKNAFFEKMYFTGIEARITLIDYQGNVLYDSVADELSMENHSGREEFKQAIENSMGETHRRSETLEEDTYYCSILLEDNTVLRLARNSRSIIGVFLGILPFDILFTLLLFIVSIFVSHKLTGRIVSPLVTASDHLDEIPEGTVYDELSPFLKKISKQNQTIFKQLSAMTEERDTINLILDNMREGFVLIDTKKRLLSVNKSAVHLLGAINQDYSQKSVIELTRNAELLSAIDSAVLGEHRTGIITTGNSDNIQATCQYFASPVLGGQNMTGVILLLLDVTKQLKAERIREEFSANVSHELKTPLTSISGFAEMIQNGMISNNEEITHFAGMIYSEAQRLLTLIGDIMRISRIEEGSSSERMEEADLFELAQDVLSILSSKAAKRNVTVAIKGKSTIMQGNVTMLHEMIFNLLDNAINYNRTGGQVEICLFSTEKDAVFCIKDTGIGISKEHHDRIFERFYRVDKSRSKQTGGTGLGLSIVKHIVEFHNGHIMFESEEGKGTLINVYLPIESTVRNEN